MGRRKSPSKAVLTDSTNSAASAQTHVGEESPQGRQAGKLVPVTFSRKAKAALKQVSSTKENAEHTPGSRSMRAITGEAASPTLTDFLTPISEAQSSPPEAFLSARTQLQHDASSSMPSRLGNSGQEGVDEPAGEQGGRDRRGNYPRRVAPSRGEQQGAAHAAYMARMAAHFAEVDDFDLTVDSPGAAGAASPDVAPAADASAADDTDSDSATAGESMPNAARTAQWLQAIPSPRTQLDRGAPGPSADHSSAAEPARREAAKSGLHGSGPHEPAASDQELRGRCSESDREAERPLTTVSAETESRRLTLTAPEEEEPCDGDEDAPEEDSIHIPLVRQPRRSSMAGRVSHKGRLSLAHARKSLVGAQLQQMGGQDAQKNVQRRSSVYEALSSRLSLSQGLSRVSLGLTSALNRLSLGPTASRRDSMAQAKGQIAPGEALQGVALIDCKKRAISPIAESPELSERDKSATPEAVSLVANSNTLKAAQPEAPSSKEEVTGLSEQLDAKLRISEEAGVEAEQAAAPDQDLTPLQLLLKLCNQETEMEALPSMEQMLSQHVKLRTVKKIGEGTFGEAFKGGDVVFKIVPMEGDLLVNGESQKKAEEITAEVAIALTLSQLHPEAGVAAQNSTEGFVQTHSVGVCRGRYAAPLVKEWHAWDKRNSSENDPVDAFGDDQLFVIFVVANGGADLEHFEVHSFEEARSIILQTVLALAVAEEAVQFEHRDLHWGNLLIKRVPAGQSIACTLRGVDIVAESHGVQITLIDFTLSRLCTIDGSGAYCDLDADPELFQGPKGDCQADTYRRMRKATKGRWEGFHPATNALWMHYLADTLLNLKAFPLDPSQKKRLRDFRKRALSGQSCSDLLMDEFLKGSWLAGGK